MAQAMIEQTLLDATVLELVTRERTMALSTREWKFRLAGYGYAIKDVAGEQVVTSLLKGTELGKLPHTLH